MHSCLRATMWKTFLILACVAGYMAIVLCDDEMDPPEETIPDEETEPHGTNSDGSRCGCHPPICPKNEVYYNCSGGCIPRRCSEIGYKLKCDKKCTPGCVCKDNYVRADNGTCIPIPDCPSCGGDENAQQGCGNNCGRTCSTYNKPQKPCPPGCIFNGCNCRKGYVYDNNVKACVKPEDCTPICRVNEEYSSCVNGGCDAKNCSQIGKPVPCVKPKYCIKGCICVKGYLRDSNGICVPKDQCKPQKCPVNEEYSTCINGGCVARKCSQVGKPVPCVKLHPKSCIKGCVCVKGYLRDSNGKCVPKDKCKPKCDKPNEVYDVCPAPCPPKLCYVKKAVIKCAAPPKPGDPDCKPGCRCADNYYRNATGTCVLKKNCEKPLPCYRPNEVYEPCPAICPTQECGVKLALLRCQRPPEYGDPTCKPSCVCINGYVRNNDKKCIPRDQCPQHCPVNEEYSTCINGGCDARNCSQVGKPVPCVKLDPKLCIKGCVCVKGYLRDSNGKCVPKDKCTPKCDKPNEVYDVCPAPCPPKLCYVKGAVIKCPAPPKPGDPDCKPGCRCADNYYRNATGTCVLKKNCEKPLPCNRQNEVYDPCPAICPTQECGVNLALIRCQRPPEYGDPTCKPSCVCINGYVRNNDKKCIPRDQCPQHCPVNEEYSTCINGGCDARNCSQVRKPVPCVKPDPKLCIKGCVCVKGYLRDSNGKCVPKDKCTPLPCIRPNEVYDPCPAICPTQECGVSLALILCQRPPEYGDPTCKPSCVCINGYVRNNDKKCIPRDQCPQHCPVNEEYSTCINGGCVARNCSQVGKPVPCVKLDPRLCIKGCVCVKGYLRDSNGKCVPKDKCTPKCDNPNEVYDLCPAPCPGQHCNVNPAVIKCAAPPKPGDPGCRPGCRCADNYYRNATGTCVLKKNCEKPIRCVGPNQVYSACPKTCPPQKCGINPSLIFCPGNPVYGDPRCKPSCICINGYLRNDAKECIPEHKCPPFRCDGPNEEYDSCPANCPGESCTDYINCTKCPPYNIDVVVACKPQCRCKKGYYRNSLGICILASQCGTPKCPKNEVYYNCTGECVPRHCSEIGYKLTCGKHCTPGCVCKDNYVRADDGTCIPIPNCPSCAGDINAVQGCSNYCGRSCSSYNKPPPACPLFCIFNGCDCRKGFVYDYNVKACVKPEDCTPICKINEEYSPCINGGCDARYCSQIGKPVSCVKLDPKYCIKGCICLKGYLRDSNGACVPKDQCIRYPPICPKNEVYYNCTGECVPRHCSEIGYKLTCGKYCTPGCVCKDNYVRADDGTCIPIPNCPSCAGDINAVQGCSNYCGRSCSSYNKPPKACPLFCIFNGCDCRKGFVYDYNVKACVKPEDCTPICKINEEYSPCINGGCDARYCSQIGKPVSCVKLDPKYCIKGCICVKGYLRDSNGACVPKDQCIRYPPICPLNEVYYNCTGECVPRRCSEIGYLNLKCDKNCTPGCVCKDNYVRADNGACIPIPNCPSCAGDINAVQGCSNYCGRSCSSYNKPPTPCPLFCIFNGCDCRTGFVYDYNVKACVKPEDCTPICKINEEYSPCINGGCDARYCSQIGKPVPCVKLDPKYCIKGCICVKGYLRDSNGACVPKDQCIRYPPICPKNEVYYNCTGECVPRHCSEIGYKLTCGKHCKLGCVCKDNYVRSDDGTCIPIADCPSCAGDINAVQGCSNYCGRSCSSYNKPPPACPLFCIFNGCDCRKGFVYDYNVKACVKPEDCTPICKINEEYSPCINGGCDARNCSQIGKPVPCVKLDPKYCIKGCTCVQGYLRASNGTCIPKDQCTPTPTCPKGEFYNSCPTIKCEGDYCPKDRNSPHTCPVGIICDPPRCVCGPLHRRDRKTGKCINVSDCPPFKCDGPNEEYDSCPANCPEESCTDYINDTKYPPYKILTVVDCKPQCRCKKGYYRNSDGICILASQCGPPKCPKNEVYYNCTGECVPRHCSEIGYKLTCGKHCKLGCVCKDNYVRADNGICIPIPNCPSCAGDINAVQGCSNYCGRSCSSYNKPPTACPLFCIFNGCDCRTGFVYDYNVKACVKPEDCTPICQVNEEYSSCINGGCVAKNCSQIGKPVPCIKPKYCIKGCICVQGYLRASNGTCVPKDKCKRCPYDPNAHAGCGVNCGRTCFTYKIKTLACILTCKLNGCDCNKGYVFDPNVNKCVLPKDCTKKCGKNEHYEECYYSCGGNQSCDDIGKKYSCPAKPKCYSGCRCDKGYWRNADNVCIPEKQCPKSCGKNEYWEPCIKGCTNQSCTEVGRSTYSCPAQIDTQCPYGCGCRCKPKYYRNSDGVCVPESECPKICGKNEHYEECYYSCGGNQSCDDIGKKYNCPVKPKCYSGCRCDKGYRRNADNVCIPENQCPKPCGKNEYWEPCIPGCRKQSCTELGRPAPSCPGRPGRCSYGSGCRCKPKYYRNSDGVCVPESDCPRCYGQNEVWVDCIQGCSNQSCDDIGKIFHCPNEPAGKCRSGCRCQPGTWRNASNVCVPQGKCPTPDCPTGEVWNWCPAIKCDGDYCPKTRSSPQTCPIGIVCDKPRCVCESNRKRDWKTGKCIRIQDCPKFKCDCNEEYQACPPTCPGDTCLDYINGPRRCPPHRPICRPQCKCIKDYYRDANGTCIPACDCPEETSITTTEPPGTSTSGNGTGLTGILDGITAFTGLCLYNRMKSAPSENIIMSPMSVFTPIAELCLYSKGPAYDQCIRVLNLKDKQDIRDTFPKLDASLGGQTAVNFSIANIVYSHIPYKLSESLKKDAFDVFNASAQELDFSKSQAAADTINAWVESKTNNRIKDLVTADMFSELTRLVLVNAIYFKGTWLFEFNKNNTKEEDFYLNDGTTKKTQMMSQEIKALDYGEIPSLDCRAVRVYYKGETSSMIIVLPNTKNGTLDLAKNLQDPINWKKVTNSFSPQRVKLYLPLFKITTTTNLKELLKKANIVNWFDCENSGLYGILKKDENFCITEAIQKAYVEVNEEGAEAAAANAVVVTTRSLPLPPPVMKEFKANRAFLYYLEVGSVVTLCGALNS